MKEREKPNLDHNKRLPSFQSEREDKKRENKKNKNCAGTETWISN